MNYRLTSLFLLALVTFPVTVLSQQQYQFDTLAKNVNRFDAIVSNSGQTAAFVESKNTKPNIRYINTGDSSILGIQALKLLDVSGRVTRGFFSHHDVELLSVNDSGLLLVGVTIDEYTGGPEPATCGVVKLNLVTGEVETLFTYIHEFSCTLNVRASINNDGTSFIVYHDSANEQRRFIYSYLKDGVKSDVHIETNPDDRFSSPASPFISSTGEAQSYIQNINNTPGQLLFYSPESGLSLHSLPEELQFKDIKDFSGSKYLFVEQFFTKGVPDEIYVYTLNESRDNGTIVSTTSTELESILKNKDRKFKKDSFISIEQINSSGQVFVEISKFNRKKDRSTFDNIALTDFNTIDILLDNSQGISEKGKKKAFKKFTVIVKATASGELFAIADKVASRKRKSSPVGSLLRFSPID